MKPAHLRPRARQDLADITRWYVENAGEAVAERFLAAALTVLQDASETPGLGSPAIGAELGVAGLRRVGVAGFRYSWIYLDGASSLDVARLLSDRQDINAELEESFSIADVEQPDEG